MQAYSLHINTQENASEVFEVEFLDKEFTVCKHGYKSKKIDIAFTKRLDG
jgi:hypothetical protein